MFIRSLILRSAGFNTQPPEGGWGQAFTKAFQSVVSTHSRLKAAGKDSPTTTPRSHGFNTQPPEGGWVGYF